MLLPLSAAFAYFTIWSFLIASLMRSPLEGATGAPQPGVSSNAENISEMVVVVSLAPITQTVPASCHASVTYPAHLCDSVTQQAPPVTGNTMASLNKLAIRGIRSFDDKSVAVIEFFNPVTVIVGHNGSGKTTIIECLKYATTGDQPANTRGGAFIHDPKMANEKEVRAQVKLRFDAANGNRMLVVRNVSVTMKRTGTMTMKTLETILAKADEHAESKGKRGVISTKCAELDVEIPHLLGVSKAVLENVIFCHQEDSYWPLSEPAALKKKFDDIFEATKYTKALDSIKSLRKDRMAELKAEKERLDSLYREKNHSDKLKERVSDLTNTIVAKEREHDELKEQYEKLVKANATFYESATKFRETYNQILHLEENKARYQKDLDNARENLQELEGSELTIVAGTDQELADRLKNFDEHIMQQKRTRREKLAKQQDVEDDLAAMRKAHVELNSEQGRLEAEAKAQEGRITDREALIRDISAKQQIKGYDHSPLEREKVLDFITKLSELKRRRNLETDRLQEDSKTRNDEYNAKLRHMHTQLEAFKQQKSNLRDRIVTLQTSVSQAEAEAEEAQTLVSQLRTLQSDIEEKQRRIESTKAEMRTANFEGRLAEKNTKGRSMELQRDELTGEIRTLSLQSDARAKLNLKRTELRSKSSEVKNTIELHNDKFRKLVGVDARPDTMERELDRVTIEKEREHSELESESTVANKNLQMTETMLSNLKSQVMAKHEEIKSLDKQLRDGLGPEESSVQDAVDTANKEINIRTEDLGKLAGTHDLYQRLLNIGKSKKCCPLCTRDMNNQEMDVYEKSVKEHIKRSTPQTVKEIQEELKDWEKELRNLQDLGKFAASRENINLEIPALEKQIKEHEASYSAVTEKAEEALKKLNEMKRQLREISALRQHAALVTRTQKDIERLQREIGVLESDLSTTGSTKNTEDVQTELDALSTEIRANEREKQAVMTERDRVANSLRGYENDLNAMLLRESELKSEIRDKTALEKRAEDMKKEITASTTLVKVRHDCHIWKQSLTFISMKDLDVKIAEAQGPIERLEQEYQTVQRELNAKIAQAQQTSQELNISTDKLDNMNKVVERYVRDKRGRLLKECNDKIEEYEAEIAKLATQLEETRNAVHSIDKEINESGASVANLRENLRVRNLIQEIDATQREIDSHDLEENARHRRLFDDQYKVEKERETKLQGDFAHIGGELSSLRSQLKTLQVDQREFKDVAKKYRDQLIKVKMSDMANNDLEKYAKALDNAIMKYHSLKMEEVNDTMRHLWNKTYQGTDIDGIKISSDSEGGATKRSYNYRVVMTKDQVEMDMRGRCSAGQKMLASIIIRLALADSFGQNCGILALDEPTNALDTENIDALAASLVDIINERKNHANFQLIIITHDENFLGKLGQSNVMEHYWRVVRNSKQKSVIERHRFG
ncbi:P-loop containing nucleoside triphosphate hydrolase protein [Amylocystis lapponica]|nr:P-loop containing nucleoside triphosphate hydrolase protein [Amylocystis lapponica]